MSRSYDARLGFGLYLAFALAQRSVPESRLVIDLTSREHGITGAA